ncbi:MAG: hypothetical protein KJ722_03770 [Candidatus Omnitrophica bacterium]|nr:hypothetical protein [Candidatus Omnitrophota bacterium]MBU2221717.1 hypothetical protein [Candidatus Omnitrophota bacterium]
MINEKKELQERTRDFAAGSNNRFEQAKEFVTSLNRARCAIEEGNLEFQKEFLKKIGSNFILKERRLNFSTEASFRPLFEAAPYPCWRRGRDTLEFNLNKPLLPPETPPETSPNFVIIPSSARQLKHFC